VAKGQTHKNLAFLFQRIGDESTLCVDLENMFNVLVKDQNSFKKMIVNIKTVSR
jgi:Ca2+-binding EF-hand superfamily protein